METKSKSIVWVMIMTVMAELESSCKQSSNINAPNGTAFGYFQLHKGSEFKNLRGNDCPKNASLDPKLATQCALAMLEEQMERTGGDLFNKKSYWEVLNPDSGLRKADKIARALYRSSLCNPKML